MFVGGVFLCVYLVITLVSCSVYFERARSLGVSLAGRVIFSLYGAPLCGVSGRYNLFERSPGVDGGTVQVFLSLALL